MNVVRTRIRALAGTVDAIRAVPATSPSPGILLVHDAWGLDDAIADLAGALADRGYAVLAPDLVWGRRASDAAAATAVAAATDAEDAARLLAIAVDHLGADPAVRGGPIGAVGVGMGAPLAAFTATIRPEISVVVALDGPVPDLPIDAWARARASLLVVAATEDPGPCAYHPEAALDLPRAAGLEARAVIRSVAPGDESDLVVWLLADRLPVAGR